MAATSGRERILETAYELFSRHGTKAVGVDRIEGLDQARNREKAKF